MRQYRVKWYNVREPSGHSEVHESHHIEFDIHIPRAFVVEVFYLERLHEILNESKFLEVRGCGDLRFRQVIRGQVIQGQVIRGLFYA
jgi:hypothetical protein